MPRNLAYVNLKEASDLLRFSYFSDKGVQNACSCNVLIIEFVKRVQRARYEEFVLTLAYAYLGYLSEKEGGLTNEGKIALDASSLKERKKEREILSLELLKIVFQGAASLLISNFFGIPLFALCAGDDSSSEEEPDGGVGGEPGPSSIKRKNPDDEAGPSSVRPRIDSGETFSQQGAAPLPPEEIPQDQHRDCVDAEN